MELIIPAAILIGVPILYLLLQLYWRLVPKHRPRRRNANQELQHRDQHGAWFYMGGGDSGGGGGGDSGGGGGPS
jgi:uncharacterized membrane protein YgcG